MQKLRSLRQQLRNCKAKVSDGFFAVVLYFLVMIGRSQINASKNGLGTAKRICAVLLLLVVSNSALLVYIAILTSSCHNALRQNLNSTIRKPTRTNGLSAFIDDDDICSNDDSSQTPIQQRKIIQRVFVVGASHSGTSILERTIGNMIGVMCIGFESKLFDGSYSTANVLSQLSNWDMLARTGGYTHWVEKTPAHICHLREIFATSPDAKIVWIHREPHKVALSLIARRDNLFKNASLALNFWADSNRCVLDMLPNPNILEVTHRDFTSMDRVYSVLANISAFLGLAQNVHDPLALLGPSTAERCHPVTCQRYANDTAKREDLRTALLRTLVDDPHHRRRRLGQHSERRSWQLCQPWYGDRNQPPPMASARFLNYAKAPRVGDIVRRLYPHLLSSSSSAEVAQTSDAVPEQDQVDRRSARLDPQQ